MKLVKQILAVAMIVSALTTLTACNTVEGAGKDTQRAGEKMQDAADRNK
ncbi:MAG TPA: entericidin A/B family lipoprotein [Tepidisphaeraceae bacterium]|jgi:predicted small secreted protein